MDGRSRHKMRELWRIFAGSSRCVRSQILLGGASKTRQAKSDEYCHKSFVENVQVGVIGCKEAPLHSPNLRPRSAWERPGPFVFASHSPGTRSTTQGCLLSGLTAWCASTPGASSRRCPRGHGPSDHEHDQPARRVARPDRITDLRARRLAFARHKPRENRPRPCCLRQKP